MSVQRSEQFSPYSAWTVAQEFIRVHGRSLGGDDRTTDLVQVLMTGVWVGCRFALVDDDLALAIAAFGNAQSGSLFDAFRSGFAAEFGESMQEVVHDVLYERGFTHAWSELVQAPLASATARGEVEERKGVHQKGQGQSIAGGEGGDE